MEYATYFNTSSTSSANKNLADDNNSDDDIGPNRKFPIVQHHDDTWHPIYSFSEWTDGKNLQKRLTIAVVLPSGVASQNDNDAAKIRVSEDLSSLVVTVKWPKLLTNIDHLHMHWTSKDGTCLPNYHPKVLGFHHFFSCLKNDNEDEMWSTAMIDLPFKVKREILDETHLESKIHGTRIVYAELVALDENNYSTASKDKSFTKLDI